MSSIASRIEAWQPRGFTMAPDEWSEQFISLPASTPKPGPLKLEAWQRAVLKAMTDDDVMKVVLMTSAQIGKSLVLQCYLGWQIGVSPTTLLIVFPNERIYDRFLSEKLEPTIFNSHELKKRVKLSNQGNLDRKIIKYEGGQINVGLASAPPTLTSVTVRTILADEVDQYGMLRGQHPLASMRARTGAYDENNVKILMCSTPSLHGDSHIQKGV